MLEASVASAALVGSILGQIIAGSMADVFGRKKIFVITAALITIGSFGSACCLDTPYLTIYGQICCWRFLLGAGVGGEYPLAATVTSESSSPAKRGSLMAAVFAMQGVGSFISGLVVYLCLYAGCSIDFTWRFALAFGALPALLAFPWRLRMHETESFERLKKERQELDQLQQEQLTNGNTGNGNGNTGKEGYGHNPIILPTEFDPLLLVSNGNGNGNTGMLYDGNGNGTTGIPESDYGQHLLITSRNNSNTTGTYQHPYQPHPHGNTGNTLTNNLTINTTTTGTPSSVPVVPSVVANIPRGRWREVAQAFHFYRYHMLGTALCWFLLDVDFYANGLFNHQVTALILGTGGNGNGNTGMGLPYGNTGMLVGGSEEVVLRGSEMTDALVSMAISLVALPGYLLSVYYIEIVGRKNIQLTGFAVMGTLFFLCGYGYDWLLGNNSNTTSYTSSVGGGGGEAGGYGKYLFLLIYSLTFLFR